MSDLAAFVLARVAETESEAQEAVEYEDNVWETAGWLPPSRVLAECEAKRRIVTDYGLYEQPPRRNLSLFGERILRIMARPYSDHPDFDPAWGA